MGLNTAASLSFSQINSAAFFTNGNLGVNTTSPAFNLDVNGTINVSGKSTLQNITATNVSATNLVTTSITSGILSATNIIGPNAIATFFQSLGFTSGVLSATTITGSNLSLSDNLMIGGTLTSVNVTSTNIVNTNISTGTLNASGKSTLTNTTVTNTTTGTLIASTGITTGTINATGTSTLVNATVTNTSTGTINASGTSTLLNTTATNTSTGVLIASTGITSGNVRINSGSNGFGLYMQGSNLNGPVITLENLATGGLKYAVGSTATGSVAGAGFSIYDQTNNASRLLIGSSGYTGINTTTPAFTLDVNGSINASTSITTAALSATNISTGRIVGTGISTGSLYTDGITVGSDIKLVDNFIYLKSGNNSNYGVGHNSSVDGPNIWGNYGGQLWSQNTPQYSSALYWNHNSIGVDTTNNNGLTWITNTVSINTTTDIPAINPDAYNTLLVHEDMQGTSLRYGTLSGTATYVQNSYIQLSPDSGGSGTWYLGNMHLGNSFTVDYEAQIPGSADAHQFFWGNYAIQFHEYNDRIRLYYGGNFLTETYKYMGWSENWYKIRIVFQRNTIKIYHDGTLCINYKDIARHENYSNANSMYFNCFTGGETSAHRIRDVRISKLMEGAWSYTTQTSGNVMFNGGNVGVGIGATSAAYTLDIYGSTMLRGNLYSTSVPNSTSAIPLVKASAGFVCPDGSNIIVGNNGASGSGKSNNYNIASITRSAAGTYNIVFTNPMPTSVYTVSTGFQRIAANWQFMSTSNFSTTGFTLKYYSEGALTDNGNWMFFAVI